MQSQQPHSSNQKSATDNQARQARNPLLSPVTSIWRTLHDPVALRRAVLVRWTRAQHMQAGLIRPLRPMVEREQPGEVRLGAPQPHETRHDKVHQRDEAAYGSFLSRSRHLEHEPLTVDHHDFTSRFRER